MDITDIERAMEEGQKQLEEFAATTYAREQLAAAARFVGLEMARAFQQEWDDRIRGDVALEIGEMLPDFDSPLEMAFWTWWLALQKIDVYAQGLRLAPHWRTASGYVLDFVILPRSSRLRPESAVWDNWPFVAVELDGHAFHEKTIEQVTYRNQRDRELQQSGWKLFHYSFSEFTKDPVGCLTEIVDYLRAEELKRVKREPVEPATV